MYPFFVFVHVSSAFVFMLAHGATATVMYRLRVEREPAALRTLFAVRDAADLPFSVSAGIMLLSGIGLAFLGKWWRAGWIWASLAGFLMITVVMSLLGRAYFEQARALLEAGEAEGSSAPTGAFTEEISSVLASGRPHLLMAVGVGGFIAIVYLMMFKPF